MVCYSFLKLPAQVLLFRGNEIYRDLTPILLLTLNCLCCECSQQNRILNCVQSRPIEMRVTILYLANRWTEFEMLLTPLRLLYLVMFSLLAFPPIPQFIAHFLANQFLFMHCPPFCSLTEGKEEKDGSRGKMGRACFAAALISIGI